MRCYLKIKAVNTIKLGQRSIIIGGVVCFCIFGLNTSAIANSDAYTLADKAIGWAGKLWDFVSVQIKKENDFEVYENKAYPVIYSEVEKYKYPKPNPIDSRTYLRKYETDRHPPEHEGFGRNQGYDCNQRHSSDRKFKVGELYNRTGES